MYRILVTGSGGIGGVNFVRALKIFKEKFFIVGTDFNKFYLQFPDVDVRVKSPKHSDPQFIQLIKNLVQEHKIDFVHPQPSSEALVIAEQKNSIGTKTFLPESSIISKDKLDVQQELSKNGISIAQTQLIDTPEKIDEAFESLGGGPLWVRAKSGAGGNLSLLCKNAEEAQHWIKLWVTKGRANYDDFLIQQYLPNRNLAWDSLWFKGKLIASFTRERLEYPLKHISPSGITGTPSVSKIVVDKSVNKIGEQAIKVIDSNPHGNYAVDLKEDANGKFYVTEIDSGKFHTTTPLWGYISTKTLNQDPQNNLPYLYTLLGLEELSDPKILGNDIYPNGLHLLRHIDCGVWILHEDGKKEKVL